MKKLLIVLLPIFICTLGCKKDNESEIPTGWQESMSGKILFSRQYSNKASRLFYYDDSGLKDVTPVGNDYDEIFGASWSPDGSQVVFTHYQKQLRYRLSVIDSDGTNEKTIWQKERGISKTGPVWLSDTNLIGFATYDYNNDMIQITNSMGDSLQSYRLDADYAGSPYNTKRLKRSPNNNAITYCYRNVENCIMELNVITHSNNIFYQFPDSSYSSYFASISKDGKSVAYMNPIGSGRYHLLIFDVHGGEIIQDIDLEQFDLCFSDLSWSQNCEMIAIGLRRDNIGGGFKRDLGGGYYPDRRSGILICDIHGNIVTHLIDADVTSVDWQ